MLSTKRLRIECVREVQPDTDEDGNPLPGQQAAGNHFGAEPIGGCAGTGRYGDRRYRHGGDGWEDPNKPRQIEIKFDLPQGDDTVHVQTFVDGKETGYGDPDLPDSRPQAERRCKVEIYIDGQLYKSYDVNLTTAPGNHRPAGSGRVPFPRKNTPMKSGTTDTSSRRRTTTNNR